MRLKTKLSKSFILLRILIASIDFIIITSFSLLAHFNVLFHSSITSIQLTSTLLMMFASTLTTIILFLIFKVYLILTTQTTISDCIKIALIAFITQMVFFVIELLCSIYVSNYFVKVSIVPYLVSSISVSLVLPSIRMIVRYFYYFHFIKKKDISNCETTALIGAGMVAKTLCGESLSNKNNKYNISVLVDDDENKIGGTIYGIPIEGPIDNIKEIIDKYNIETVIIAISNLSEDKLHYLIKLLSSCNVRIQRAPLLSEMNGPNDIRIFNVDLNELLSRKPVKLDNHEIKDMLYQQVVLITGAGGSIGSELVRQIFITHPSKLILFDIYENSTYDIQMELMSRIRNENIKDIELITLIGSTYNYQRMEQIISKYRPTYIYHAAAYKHVPLMEDSPQEAIRTNVIGTYNVAKLANIYKVKKMILVSTDKAVRPTNVMGATKRFAEKIIQYFDSVSTDTSYAAVRFGNVLGSNGSVVPLFKKQIEEGGPLTITDKRITRFFMTIPEAVSLILQCGLFAKDGEIFILDMGEPVKILTLAEMLIRQTGLKPYKDIDIIEIGLRPGEKLYEELLVDKSIHQKTKNERIFIETPEPIEDIEKQIVEISKVFEMDDVGEVDNTLRSIITTYEEGKC